jgi:hypothetical protein
MLTIHCPLLSQNAKLLRDMYDKRDLLIARGGSAIELKAAEYDLIRMHRIVKRHRTRCPRCRLNDGRMTASRCARNLCSVKRPFTDSGSLTIEVPSSGTEKEIFGRILLADEVSPRRARRNWPCFLLG